MTIAVYLAVAAAVLVVVCAAAASVAVARRHLGLAEHLARLLEQANTREGSARATASALRDELAQRPHADIEGERVVVVTKDHQSIDGDVARVFGDGGLRLDHARYLSDSGQEMGGSVTVAGDNISWVQQAPNKPQPVGT